MEGKEVEIKLYRLNNSKIKMQKSKIQVKSQKKILKDLYFQLLLIRMVEERIAEEYKKQEIRCPTHLYIGQEAIAVGVSAIFRKKDLVFSYHRSHGHYLAKGGDLKAMIAELYGKATGCSCGMGGSQHLIDLSVNFCGAIPIVSETVPLAVGAIWAERMKGNDTLGTVFLGDAVTEQGIFSESVNFAVLKRIPVLFVCENNLYSISTHILDRQPFSKIAPRVSGMGIQTYIGDGNNVLDVYNVSKKAISYIKREEKPAYVEFATYRYLEHCGPLYDLPGVRPEKEIREWQKKDPVKRFSEYVLKKRILSDAEIEKMKDEIKREIDKAFEFAKKSPYPDKEMIGKVYA